MAGKGSPSHSGYMSRKNSPWSQLASLLIGEAARMGAVVHSVWVSSLLGLRPGSPPRVAAWGRRGKARGVPGRHKPQTPQSFSPSVKST